MYLSKINICDAISEFQEDNNLISYPLNLKKICKNNNWPIIKYNKKHFLNLKLPKDGFSIKDEHSFNILYNEYIRSKQRIRFTIAHEIGHIVLGHHYFTKEYYKQNEKYIEQQADYFAGNLLVPAILLKHNKEFINDIKLLRDYFDVSEECAKNRIEFYNYWDLRIKYGEEFKNNILDYTNKNLH